MFVQFVRSILVTHVVFASFALAGEYPAPNQNFKLEAYNSEKGSIVVSYTNDNSLMSEPEKEVEARIVEVNLDNKKRDQVLATFTAGQMKKDSQAISKFVQALYKKGYKAVLKKKVIKGEPSPNVKYPAQEVSFSDPIKKDGRFKLSAVPRSNGLPVPLSIDYVEPSGKVLKLSSTRRMVKHSSEIGVYAIFFDQFMVGSVQDWISLEFWVLKLQKSRVE